MLYLVPIGFRKNSTVFCFFGTKDKIYTRGEPQKDIPLLETSSATYMKDLHDFPLPSGTETPMHGFIEIQFADRMNSKKISVFFSFCLLFFSEKMKSE